MSEPTPKCYGLLISDPVGLPMSLILLSNDKSMSKARFLLDITFPDKEISSWANPNIVPMVSSSCKIHVDWKNDCLDKSMCNIETLEKLNSYPFHFSDIECHHKSYPYPVSIFENLKCRCLSSSDGEQRISPR